MRDRRPGRANSVLITALVLLVSGLLAAGPAAAADDDESATEPARNTQIQGFYNAETTGKSASDWQLPFQVQFLLPKF